MLDRLFYNAHLAYEMMVVNQDVGVYRDAKLFGGTGGGGGTGDYHPASAANVGVGLIDLAIADSMAWVDDAEDRALRTLEAVMSAAGETETKGTEGFAPDRNGDGYFRHFMDVETGANAWDSEYSTIDTGILISGALFAGSYFADKRDNNTDILDRAVRLFESVDWAAAIADPDTGAIYRTMEKDGRGTPSSLTYPFNEYMIVAYLAKLSEEAKGGGEEGGGGGGDGPAGRLWNRFYADPSNLPRNNYWGIEVLADHPTRFLPHFVVQFAYYLCHPFAESDEYVGFMDSARKADQLWWSKAAPNVAKEYQWGLGAGSCPGGKGYCADAIDDNPERIYSPHVVAGFLPVYPEGASHLERMMLDIDGNSGAALYGFDEVPGTEILWRASLEQPEWRAKEVQGIDYASMLFGLASLPQHLGPGFFQKYNDFASIVSYKART